MGWDITIINPDGYEDYEGYMTYNYGKFFNPNLIDSMKLKYGIPKLQKVVDELIGKGIQPTEPTSWDVTESNLLYHLQEWINRFKQLDPESYFFTDNGNKWPISDNDASDNDESDNDQRDNDENDDNRSDAKQKCEIKRLGNYIFLKDEDNYVARYDLKEKHGSIDFIQQYFERCGRTNNDDICKEMHELILETMCYNNLTKL